MADKLRELYQTPFYQVWNNMKTRCFNPKNNRYSFYRNIRIEPRWLNFQGFYEDMYSSYKSGLSLDRIDNHGDYTPGNCRWATAKEQALNTRNVERARRYVFNGESKTVREWAEATGIKRTTLDMRLRGRKWPIEKALGVAGYR